MSAGTKVGFLSAEYLAELGTLVAAEEPAIPRVNVRLQFHVTGAPGGAVDHHLLIEEGVITGAGAGRVEGAELTVTVAYPDLVDFQVGGLHAATALVTGQFAVTGDKAKLLDFMVVVQSGRYHRFTADLWSRTTY